MYRFIFEFLLLESGKVEVFIRLNYLIKMWSIEDYFDQFHKNAQFMYTSYP